VAVVEKFAGAARWTTTGVGTLAHGEDDGSLGVRGLDLVRAAQAEGVVPEARGQAVGSFGKRDRSLPRGTAGSLLFNAQRRLPRMNPLFTGRGLARRTQSQARSVGARVQEG